MRVYMLDLAATMKSIVYLFHTQWSCKVLKQHHGTNNKILFTLSPTVGPNIKAYCGLGIIHFFKADFISSCQKVKFYAEFSIFL